MNSDPPRRIPFLLTAILVLVMLAGVSASYSRPQNDSSNTASPRLKFTLSGTGWQFYGSDANGTLPDVGSEAFNSAAWTNVQVPHVFQKRGDMNTEQGWYRRTMTLPSSVTGGRIYLSLKALPQLAMCT